MLPNHRWTNCESFCEPLVEDHFGFETKCSRGFVWVMIKTSQVLVDL